MPIYVIEGKRVRAEAPLTEEEIDEIGADIKARAPSVSVEEENDLLMNAPQATPAEIPDANYLGRAAKGVAETLAFPAEAAKGLMQAGGWVAGQDTSGLDEIDPSATLKGLIEGMGLDLTPGEEDGLLGNIIEAGAGGLTGLGAASRARGVFTKTGQRLMEGRLGRFAAEDLAASTGGATLKTLGQETGNSEGGANALELAGNILTGYSINKFTAPMKLYGAAKGAVDEHGKASYNEASRMLQKEVSAAGEDPKALAGTLREDQGLGTQKIDDTPLITSGAKSRSVALQSLQRTLLNLKGNTALADEYIKRGLTFNDFVRDSIRANLGGEAVSQEYIDAYLNSVEYASDIAEKTLTEATMKASKEIQSLPPIEGLDYGKEVMNRLEAVYDDLDKLQKEAWDRVPDATAIVKESPLEKALRNILEEAEPNPANTIPSWASGAVKEMAEKGEVNAKEVQALRSSLLESARQAAAGGQANLSRRLNKLADGALETLNLSESSFPEELAYARGVSREFNQRFSNDIISPLFRKARGGGDKVPDNETMDRLFTKQQKGATNFAALKAAYGDTPSEAKSYVLQKFHGRAAPDGTINVKRAKQFLDDYRPLLEEAGLTDTINSYIKYGEEVESADQALHALHSSQSKDVAANAILVGKEGAKKARTGDEFTSYLQAMIRKNDSAFAENLTDMFRTAEGAGAVEGLKTAVAEAAIKTIYTAGGDVSAFAPDRVGKIVKALETTGRYSEEQMRNFSQIADAAYRQSQADKVKIFKGQSNTAQDTMRANVLENLLSYSMLQVAGATKPSGPGALRWAQQMSRLGEKLGKKISQTTAIGIINQAVFDHELMATLLENPNTLTEASRSKLRRVIGAIGKAYKFVAGGAAQPSQAQIYGEMLEDDNGQ